MIEKILARLEKLGVLDDEEFARWWLEQRATFRPRGKIALKMELRQKGVGREIIDKVVSEGVDEIALAQKAAAKKIKVYQKLDPVAFREKMTAFLARQGFSWETIKMVIDRLLKKR